jgi:DNA-binding LacI/PurR family transcriptional regulator
MGSALPSKAPPGDAERRIGLLLTSLDNDYEWSIRAGVQAAISERQAALVSIIGSALEDPNLDQRARSFVFDLLDAETVDALLVLSGTVGRFVGPSLMASWLERYTLPTCSIGPNDQIASIVIENAEGTAKLVRHLIVEHGYRRIAFVRGPEQSAEAEARLQAYRDVLAEFELEQDPRLLLEGDFTRPGGVRAARRLFDEHQLTADDVDAIVAANDHMAIGVIEELVHRGVTVPDRVAVVGFDDSKPSHSIHPSLTTVRQPTERLGRESARTLFALLDGQALPEARPLPTELILRRSCGCMPTDAPPAPTGLPADLERVARRTYAAKEDEWDVGLVQALVREGQGRFGEFERALEPLLQRILHAQSDLHPIQDLLSLLRARALSQNLHDSLLRARIEEAVHGARSLVSRLQSRVGAQRGVSDAARIAALSQALNARMFGPSALISAALVEHLPALGFDECVVSELVPGSAGAGAELQVAFGFHAEDVQPKPVRYRASRLIPPDFRRLRGQSSVVLALGYGGEPLGIAVVPARVGERRTYELLRDMLATSLKGMILSRAASRRSELGA